MNKENDNLESQFEIWQKLIQYACMGNYWKNNYDDYGDVTPVKKPVVKEKRDSRVRRKIEMD